MASIFDMTLQYAESAVQDAVTDTLRDDEENEVLYPRKGESRNGFAQSRNSSS